MTGRSAMVEIRFKYLWMDKDRHGNKRYYVVVPGRPKVRLREPFGSEAFRHEYDAAIAGETLEARAKIRKVADGSLEWLCKAYYKSTDFKELGDETQKVRERILRKVCLKIGDKDF